MTPLEEQALNDAYEAIRYAQVVLGLGRPGTVFAKAYASVSQALLEHHERSAPGGRTARLHLNSIDGTAWSLAVDTLHIKTGAEQ